MSLKIAVILFALCHLTFCRVVLRTGVGPQEFNMTNPQTSPDPRTIITRMRNDTKGCLSVDRKYFGQCDRPEHTSDSKAVYIDYDMILCMSSYDAALRICKINNTAVLHNLQAYMEEEDRLNSSEFCERIKSTGLPVNSSFSQTKDWVPLLKVQFSKVDICKRECMQGRIKNPLCKFLLHANSLSLKFENNSSSAITTDSTVGSNLDIAQNSNSDGTTTPKFHNTDISKHVIAKKPDSRPSGNIHSEAVTQENSKMNTANVDSSATPKDSDTPAIVFTDKITQEQEEFVKNKIPIPAENPKVNSSAQPELVPKVTGDKESQAAKENPKEYSESSSILQHTGMLADDKKQESRHQDSVKSQTSTTQKTSVTSPLNERDRNKQVSVMTSTSTEPSKAEKSGDVPTKSRPIDTDISKTQGTETEDGISYNQDAAVENSIAESPTESSEIQETDVVGLDGQDFGPLDTDNADTTDTELRKDKGTTGRNDNVVFGDQFVNAEGSNFFAYFMTVVVLCIIGYLVFHNKQKILALALEGRARRGTRRRPNTSGYRKLDSNLEEAVTSACSTSVTHVIY